MADFRRISVLAALVLLLGLATTASAQITNPFACVANAAVPPTLRSEGLTELVGDIVLTCTGGTSTVTGNIPQVNFTVFLNTAVTSKLLSTTTNESEALLIVDEPGTSSNTVSTLGVCTTPLSGCTVPAGIPAGQVTPYSGAAGRPNVFRGIVSGNQVQFIGVPVDAPGTAGSRVFRITNVRANANGISAGAAGTPGTIQALLSASGSTSVPISNPTNIVGFVQSGLTFNPRRGSDIDATPNTGTHIAFAQCNSLSRTSSSGMFVMDFQENFPTAFKTVGSTTQNTPGTIYNTESGFTAAGVGATVGVANSGTRLKATFTNIPAGVSVYASLGNFYQTGISPNARARLISGEGTTTIDTPAGFTDFTRHSALSAAAWLSGGGGTAVGEGAQLAVVNGTTTAVWEVRGADSLLTEHFYFAVWFAYSANAANNSPAPGTGTVTGSFAPTATGLGVSTSAAAAASATLWIPRFAEGTQSRSIINTYLCRTNLLFPFVTNQAGFDTGIAIANTSLDTGVFQSNTSTQSGACTLFSFGDNAPASISTGNIAAGRTYVNLASSVMPNFQGYVIAACQFQFAHGFAFVSDFGARNLAMGYLALVIPEPGFDSRSARPNASAGAGSGEGLGN